MIYIGKFKLEIKIVAKNDKINLVYIKGVKNLMNCPVEPMIPVYLFVGGTFGLIRLVQTLWKQWRARRKERFDREDSTYELPTEFHDGMIRLNRGSTFIDIVISIFLFVWFIFGNYWVSFNFECFIFIVLFPKIFTQCRLFGFGCQTSNNHQNEVHLIGVQVMSTLFQ